MSSDLRSVVEHVGGKVNAEDCPACVASPTTLPYPWLCPGAAPTPEPPSGATTLADTLRQASRVNEAMRVVTAQLDRGLAARSVLVDSVGVHVIVTDGAKARWDRTFPHGHIVVGGAQVPLHVAVEGSAS